MCEAKKVLAAAKRRRQPVLPEGVDATVKEMQADPKKALEFLVNAGIVDRNKKLTKHYR